MYHSGYDYFTPEPNKWIYKTCNVCNGLMTVERNCSGPTSSVEAMSGGKHNYDKFTCSNSGKDWHTQAIYLIKEIQRTPSETISDLLREELDQILTTKRPTKEKYAKL